MADFDSICRMSADNADLADFVVVYIEEAHATDGWALSDNAHQISVHRSIEDRVTAAAKLSSFTLPGNMTVVVDTMSDELNRVYGALPERLYIIENGLVVYEGDTGPFNFSPDEVSDWLKKYRERSSTSKNIDSAKDEVDGS